LAYPAPPHDLRPSPARVSGGFPSRRPPVAEATERRPSWPLPLLQSARGTLEPPCVGSSSRGIGFPAADVPHARPLRGASPKASSRRTGAAGCRFLFRPRGFAPPRRFAPRVSCGSVAPRNRLRVHRVSCVPTGGRPKAARCRDQFPRCSSHPPKSFPRQQPETHHCDRCLPAVTVLPDIGRRPKPESVADRDPRWCGGRTTEEPALGGATAPRRARGRSRRTGLPGSEEPGGPGPGTGGRGSEEHRHRDPARWVRGSEEPRACLGGVGGSCRAGRGRIGSEEPGVRTRGNGGGRRSEEHRRRVPGASCGGSEEPLRPSVARAPKSLCGRCPDGVGPQVRRPASPPRWRGSAPSGRGVPAEPGQVVEAPKSHGGEPGITGVRARRLGTGCEEEIPMR
jgi:hypothetical protein